MPPTPSPDWAAITSAISAAVTTVVVVATAIFALRGLRDARRTRDGQLVADLSRRWDEPLTVQAQKLFADHTTAGIVTLVHKVYEGGGATDDEVADYTTLEALPNLWETIAVLEAEGAISLSVIDRMWGAAIIEGWAGWEEPVQRLRKATKTPSSYAYFEQLAKRLSSYERKEELARRLAAILGTRKRWPARALKLWMHVRSLRRRWLK